MATRRVRIAPDLASRTPGSLAPIAGLSAAAAAASVMAGTADASIIYSGAQNIPLTLNLTTTASGSIGLGDGSAMLDLDGDSVFDLRMRATNDPIVTYYSTNLRFARTGVGVAAVPGPFGAEVVPLESGSTIGGSRSFNFGGVMRGYQIGNYLGQWESTAGSFAGVRLDGRYGWVRIDLLAGRTVAIAVDWAFQSEPGVPIAAGDIPEAYRSDAHGARLARTGCAWSAVGACAHLKIKPTEPIRSGQPLLC